MHLLESRNFDRDQFTYISGRSTTQALLTVIKRVKRALLTGKEAGAIFFNFSDAFGSVNRTHLLVKEGW